MKQIMRKQFRRQRRKQGLRRQLLGTSERPRMTVYRSLRHLYVQIIDDLAGRTLVAAGTLKKGQSAGANKSVAAQLGAEVAQKAKAAGIQRIVFDRNAFRYHGRIQALADAARKGGLEF